MPVMELRKKSQITIPKEVIDGLSLQEGDKLEIGSKDGVIYMIPVSVYPKKYIEKLEKIAGEAKSNIEADIIPTFNKVSDLFLHLSDL